MFLCSTVVFDRVSAVADYSYVAAYVACEVVTKTLVPLRLWILPFSGERSGVVRMSCTPST